MDFVVFASLFSMLLDLLGLLVRSGREKDLEILRLVSADTLVLYENCVRTPWDLISSLVLASSSAPLFALLSCPMLALASKVATTAHEDAGVSRFRRARQRT